LPQFVSSRGLGVALLNVVGRWWVGHRCHHVLQEHDLSFTHTCLYARTHTCTQMCKCTCTRMHQEGQDAKRKGGSQRQCQHTNLCPETGTLVSSLPTSSTHFLWKPSFAKILGPGAHSKLPIHSSVYSVSILSELQGKFTSTSFLVGAI